MSDFSNLSSTPIIQQELKTYAVKLRNILTKLHGNKQTPQEIEQVIVDSQLFLDLSQQSSFAILQPLFNTIQNYFKALNNGLIVEQEHLEIFSAIIGELIQIADSSKQLVEQLLNSFKLNLLEKEKQLKIIIETTDPNAIIQQQTKEFVSQIEEPFIDSGLFVLLRHELETQCAILNQDLLEIEKQPDQPQLFESLMRAAHSIKGAASVLSLNLIVQLAHAMEDCFVAAKQKVSLLEMTCIDTLLKSTDLLAALSKIEVYQVNAWIENNSAMIKQLIMQLNPKNTFDVSNPLPIAQGLKEFKKSEFKISDRNKPNESTKAFQTTYAHDRILRVTAQNLNRLMGLAGESLVESRWLYPFGQQLQQLKQQHNLLSEYVDLLRDNLTKEQLNETAARAFTQLQHQMNEVRVSVNDRLRELDNFIRRHASLSDRLYQEVINSRMRPFADGIEGLARMVRDLCRQLGKQVKLVISGQTTPIDRDILEKLEAPLNHLIRNAIDHGIELPKERLEKGKAAEGIIQLEAHHRGGMLAISVSDDGRGIDVEQLRKEIIAKKLVSIEIANKLTDAEIIDFIFLPGFSTAQKLTEISGRGMGLNIIQNFIQEVGGVVRTSSIPGKGLTINLQLPLTLSVIRALLVDIAGEPYAFPLARIDQAFLIPIDSIEVIENRQFFHYEGQNIGLVSACEVLELKKTTNYLTHIPIIVLSDRLNCYGLVVDRLIGEKELVVQELDPRLGKVSDIASGALMEDGNPVLIIDVEDIVRSIDYLLSGGRLTKLAYNQDKPTLPTKRILVVDDSITVREVECRLLQNQGYIVETAVNGMDGWNAVRIGHYDLIITDIDMPRMNGIELVRAIKGDARLNNLPVMIVSYKEGEEDRLKGLEAGADYYLTKSSFHDATLIEAVIDLIGHA